MSLFSWQGQSLCLLEFGNPHKLERCARLYVTLARMAEFDLQFIVWDALGNGSSSRQERMESSSKGRRRYFEAEREADVAPSPLLIPHSSKVRTK